MSRQNRVHTTDPDFEKIVLGWAQQMDEEGEEPPIENDSGDDNWPDNVSSEEERGDAQQEVNQHFEDESSDESDFEKDLDHDDDDNNDGVEGSSQQEPRRSYYLGKDKKTKWSKSHPVQNCRTRAHNIVLRLPGPKGPAKQAKTKMECLQLFLDDTVIRLITKSTNIFISKVKDNYARSRDARYTDETEIRALIGILFLAGVIKSGRQNVLQMWDNSRGTGVEAVYLTMSRSRFRFLMRCLRFDDVTDRSERKAIDKLAPVREVLELLIEKFQKELQSIRICHRGRTTCCF